MLAGMSGSAFPYPRRRRFLPHLLAAVTTCLALATPAPAAPAGDYLGKVEAGLEVMEKANARDALPPLLAARATDTADPLVHLALGAAYLRNGAIEESEQAFAEAASWSEKRRLTEPGELAQLGRGMALLAANKPALAQMALAKAGAGGAAAACRAYARAVAGDTKAAAALDGRGSAFAAAVAGAGREAAKRYPEAQALLAAAGKEAGTALEPPTDGRVLPRLSQRNDLAGMPVALLEVRVRGSGVVTVETDLPAGLHVQFCGLLVDGVMRSMTNSQPYSFKWAVGEAGRGWHTLSIQAYAENNRVCAQGAVPVLVGDGGGQMYEPRRYAQVLGRLQQAVQPRPSLAFVEYHLARCAEAQGDLRSALVHYQAAVAVYPQYLDARPRLISACRRLGRSKQTADIKSAGRAKRGGRRVALTFDDGPHPNFTPRLLAYLRQYRVKATFFMVGTQVETFPELARAIVAAGHEPANHTYSHPNLEGLGPVGVQQELLRCEIALRRATGKTPVLFRPPGGRYNGAVRTAIGEIGYRTVLWSSNIMSPKSTDPAEVARAMMAEIKDGTIVLLHNGYDYTGQVLPLLLPELAKRGYRFVTVSELLAS